MRGTPDFSPSHCLPSSLLFHLTLFGCYPLLHTSPSIFSLFAFATLFYAYLILPKQDTCLHTPVGYLHMFGMGQDGTEEDGQERERQALCLPLCHGGRGGLISSLPIPIQASMQPLLEGFGLQIPNSDMPPHHICIFLGRGCFQKRLSSLKNI